MDENKFGTFRSTYKKTTFILCLTMMYPNVNTRKQRLLGFAITTLAFLPTVLILLFNVIQAIIKLDVMNLTHHSTVVGPYFGGLLKIALSNFRAVEGQKIIAEIDRDYALYNTLPKKYHVTVKSWINNSSTYVDNFWNLMVALSGTTYLSLAVVNNIKSILVEDIPRRINVHDALLPFLEPEERFETPYFEFMFGQCIIGTVIFVLYYSGFDAFLALALNHACLKIEIYCEALVDALKCKNEKQKMNKIGNVIKEQLRLFEYVATIQIYFNWLLGTLLFATLIQIGTCLYHITENEQTDYQRMTITLVTIGAIYSPCYYATKLKYTAHESATKFYLAGWHKIYCINTRKIVLFMMCRAQIPTCILGYNFITFEMSLFLSILQSAYSIYTLLCT